MSEPVQLAKAAREQLAAALNALQTSDVPDELVDAAEPVAQAMGVLHRIERTNGANLDGRDDALAAVRSALSRVQMVEARHPAVEIVMEAVAGSLSKVHALARYQPPAPPPAPAPAPAPPRPAAAPAPAPVAPRPQPVAVAAFTPPPAAPTAPAPQPFAGAKPEATLPLSGGTQVIDTPMGRPGATLAMAPGESSGTSPAFAQHQRRETPPVISPQFAQAARAATPPVQPAPPTQPAAPAPATATPTVVSKGASAASGGPNKIDVELGIHSASNFYKGLGGNDVIEHGGIFVATYKVLKIHTAVTLRILLPGDYEFTAGAVVQWTREGAGSSEPGYGARFTQITPEGRQLVYRYTRNREPMFYDDL
jgi:Tfp pilus assembly protein PilZ